MSNDQLWYTFDYVYDQWVGAKGPKEMYIKCPYGDISIKVLNELLANGLMLIEMDHDPKGTTFRLYANLPVQE